MTLAELADDSPSELTRRPVPRWITNPDLIASIEAGLIDIDDAFMGEPK